MSDSTPDARQVRTRAKLLAALLSLLDRQPFEAITVRAITSEAGVGYATFFRHYPDKEALLDDLAADEISELLTRVMPLFSAADTRRACVALFESLGPRRKLWRALLTGGAAQALRTQFVEQARAIAAGFEPVPEDSFCPVDLRVSFAASATLEIIAWWLAADEDFAVERIAEILDRLVITPTVAS